MNRRFDLVRGAIATAVVLAVTFHGAAAFAQNGGGMNLSWFDCGAAGTLSTSFACTSNTLNLGTMILSAVSGVDMPQLNGMEAVIYLQANQPSLPPWWHLESGGCRGPSALVYTQDFTAGPFTCLDPWAGQASGSLTFTPQSSNSAVIQAAASTANPTSILGTEEYYLAKIRILGDKSTGDGSCAGCTAGACIVAGSVKLTQPAGAPIGNVILTLPWIRQYVTFQAGGTLGGNCPPISDPVEAKRSTWGSVKSLYR